MMLKVIKYTKRIMSTNIYKDYLQLLHTSPHRNHTHTSTYTYTSDCETHIYVDTHVDVYAFLAASLTEGIKGAPLSAL